MAKNKKEKKGIVKEFKEFALQGNLFDMAVGVLIGGVFKDLVASFTDNIIMPIIGIFTGGLNFSKWRIPLPSLFTKYEEVEVGGEIVKQKVQNYLTFGNFISSVITFFILAIVIFLMIKGMNKLRENAKKKAEEEAAEAAPAEPSNEEKLLTEIRDLLSQKN